MAYCGHSHKLGVPDTVYNYSVYVYVLRGGLVLYLLFHLCLSLMYLGWGGGVGGGGGGWQGVVKKCKNM